MRGAGTYGIGWQVKQVRIREIDPSGKVARCVDTEGQVLDVPLAVHRTGIKPEVGQIWYADRDLAAWTLRALYEPDSTKVFPAPLEIPQAGPWQPLTLLAGWQASTFPDSPPEVRVTAHGMIELSGVILNGTASGGSYLTVATAPEGLPDHYKVNCLLASQSTSVNAYIRGSFGADGTVQIVSSDAAYAPSWIDLSALRARVR